MWFQLVVCELCKAEKLTEWKHEDEVCYVCRCKSHPQQWIIVLKRHARLPSPEEAEHVQQLASKLFPQKAWRYPMSILDHWHLHSTG